METIKSSILSALAVLPKSWKVLGISEAVRMADLSDEQAAKILVCVRSAALDASVAARQHRLGREIRALDAVKSQESREKAVDMNEMLGAIDNLLA